MSGRTILLREQSAFSRVSASSLLSSGGSYKMSISRLNVTGRPVSLSIQTSMSCFVIDLTLCIPFSKCNHLWFWPLLLEGNATIACVCGALALTFRYASSAISSCPGGGLIQTDLPSYSSW